MKVVIFRDKDTNKITDYTNWKPNHTDAIIKAYNDRETCPTRAQVIDIGEDSIAYYFYKMKTSRIKDEAENLRDLKDTLEGLIDRIDDRLYEFDKWLEKEKSND